jgi:energy-coupling factor transport system ATP-binding protein
MGTVETGASSGFASGLAGGLLIEPGSFVVVCGLTESGKGEFLRGLAPVEIDGEGGEDVDKTDSPFFADMASLLGVAGLANRDSALLSVGQRQRLSLAHRLAAQMPSFVLDEPTAHLDPACAWLLLRFLIRLNQEQQATVVISDRHLEELFPVCNRVLFFLKNRVVYDGDVQGFIVKASANAAAFTSALPANVTIPLIRHMKAAAAEGHDPMAGTYLIARYPLSVPEARERLETWPEVKLQLAAEEDAEEAPAAREVAAGADATKPTRLEAGGLKLRGGEIVACMGDNGSGKTRLLETLHEEALANGLTPLLLHQELRNGAEQLAALKDTLNQAEGASAVGVAAEGASAGTAEGVGAVGDENPATANAPKLRILLLDEPTAAIDAATAQKQTRRVTALRDAGWLIVITTQDLDFAAAIADSCVMVTDGKPSDPLSPQDFFDNALLYTTVVNRVTRGLLNRCVNLGDLKRYL